MAVLNKALGFEPDQSTEDGWAALRELYADSPQASRRRKRFAEALKLQNYRANALGVELGQRYTSSAVVDDGTPFPEVQGDVDLYYQRTTHPGAYLPHAWVEHECRQISTLDLAGHGRFCLIVGIGGSSWAQAAVKASDELCIDLPVFAIGLRCPYDDVLGEWTAIREVSDWGAILVRPDRHIAWRSMDMVESPADVLTSALGQVLSVNSSGIGVRNHPG
ncbi:hypothetical protein [Bradyrhizobium sp. LA7.1]|uniref:aromatic-ring hydroxylase C-terminal domain-containing protein n=1 Tax=Bradyrhizobium sp. LA7.1 TaxID=3156324 RepID=UPI003394FE69